MTTPKFREIGHKKAGRLNLGKPHIMWGRGTGEWVLATYSWDEKNVDPSMITPCVEFLEYLEWSWTPRDKS